MELGADLVLHSATKYLAGHNDVLAGALVGKREIISEVSVGEGHQQLCHSIFSIQVRDLHGSLGGVLDPHAAYLVLRGMKTLGVRVQTQNKSGMKVHVQLISPVA
jgi:cystathionine gamma-synthase